MQGIKVIAVAAMLAFHGAAGGTVYHEALTVETDQKKVVNPYEKGGTYESWCDCSDDENSFGLSVWDKPNAREYCDELVVRVKVNYEDVGRVVHNGGKIRCFKIEVLD